MKRFHCIYILYALLTLKCSSEAKKKNNNNENWNKIEKKTRKRKNFCMHMLAYSLVYFESANWADIQKITKKKFVVQTSGKALSEN